MAEDQDFPIRWLISQKKASVAGYQSQLYPEMGYVFGKKKNGPTGIDYYQCLLCKRVAEKNNKLNDQQRNILRTLRVSGDSFLSNPL